MKSQCQYSIYQYSKCNHTPYRVFGMIQGNRAAGLTHMDQCSSRRTVSAEKMIFVDACYFCLGPRWGRTASSC